MTDNVNVPREVLDRLVAWINREVPVPTRSATRWAMDITDLLAAAPKAGPVNSTDPASDARVISYEDAHATAVELGYASLTEAMEDLERLQKDRDAFDGLGDGAPASH